MEPAAMDQESHLGNIQTLQIKVFSSVQHKQVLRSICQIRYPFKHSNVNLWILLAQWFYLRFSHFSPQVSGQIGWQAITIENCVEETEKEEVTTYLFQAFSSPWASDFLHGTLQPSTPRRGANAVDQSRFNPADHLRKIQAGVCICCGEPGNVLHARPIHPK